jgi:hypothetical protein
MTDERKDAFALLKRLRDEHPRASEEELVQLFVAEVMADEGYQRDVVRKVVEDFVRQHRH